MWWAPLLSLLISCQFLGPISAAFSGGARAVLTPRDMNLATASGTTIEATAACGVDEMGHPVQDTYCLLGGANPYSPYMTHYLEHNADEVPPEEMKAGGKSEKTGYSERGHNCHQCYGPDDHPASAMADGFSTWWQSPPLSRGMQYNEVNITINLKQEFSIAYVWIQMANTPRPATWALERSTDFGKTWQPWQYFAETDAQCEEEFGPESLAPLLEDDSVICTTKYSKIVPLENGEIYVRLLQDRPSRLNWTHSEKLMQFMRATNVRLRLLKTKTLRGHLMGAQSLRDPTVTARYFYAIKEIYMGGRCVCHGHGDTCDMLDPTRPDMLLCRCKHNTMGDRCDKCQPGFEQKPWRPARQGDVFQCEPCNCHGHSNECYYDAETARLGLSMDIHGNMEGGGVCTNCQDNTEGINCNECAFGYYNPKDRPRNATNACEPCTHCDPFRHSGDCADETMECYCNERFSGENCTECAHGYYEPDDDPGQCKLCDCYVNGTQGDVCLPQDGQCPCVSNYAGMNCDDCAPGYYNVSADCTECICDTAGSENQNCNTTTGQCECQSNFAGLTCDKCAVGYYDHPNCEFCDCDPAGTEPGVCNNQTGVCLCKPGYAGDRCDKCNTTYYGYPNCTACECDSVGSEQPECDQEKGQCPCFANFTRRQCDKCATGYYAYPECKPCDCFKPGSEGITCDQNGYCYCRDNFEGQQCERCMPERYNFPLCEECNCDPNGVIADFAGCDSVPPGELCTCKANVQGRICNECKPTTWMLDVRHTEGCIDCGCSKNGSLSTSNECDMKTGQCLCRMHTTGRDCGQCKDGYYDLAMYNQHGCQACTCDMGGSANNVCDKRTGQCQCKDKINGPNCDKPIAMHYTPTLHHLKYEAESARTANNEPVRYSGKEEVFNNYSYRGFAVFSTIQPEIFMDAQIPKSAMYQVLVRYVNPTDQPVQLNVTLDPMQPSEDAVTQMQSVTLLPNAANAASTVPVNTNDNNPYVLNAGQWKMKLNTAPDKRLFVDYVVLLPSNYYEADQLRQPVRDVCKALQNASQACLEVAYPPMGGDPPLQPGTEFINEATGDPQPDYPSERYPNSDKKLAYISAPPSPKVKVEVPLAKPGEPHILVMQYYNLLPEPITLNVQAEQEGQETPHNGTVHVNMCASKELCRETVITPDRHPLKVPTIADNDKLTVTLSTDDEDTDFGIHSITAVPESQWQPKMTKPSVKCVSLEGKCLPDIYELPDGAVVMQAETDKNDTITMAELTDDAVDTATPMEMVAVEKGKPPVMIEHTVPKPAYYILIADYYNPDSGPVSLPVSVKNGQEQHANLSVEHCPNLSGCRAVLIRNADGRREFHTSDKVNIAIAPSADQTGPVYIDKITAVPYESFRDEQLKPLPADVSERYTQECSKEHFKNDPESVSDFCRGRVFSLTTDFNDGALTCDCHAQGSNSFECAEYGGQCPCRENVIGRQCDRCKEGYFGFPNCQPCQCQPGQLCQPELGECYCPPFVTGDQCDQCVEHAYGYDELIGCQSCGCNEQASERVKCDPITGQCECKNTVGGRTCDKCLDGFFYFPECRECRCDKAGTTGEVCNKDNGACICKENVEGQTCQQCSAGSFNLEDSNPDGCTKCFCFGTTDSCQNSRMAKSEILSMSDWAASSGEIEEPTDNSTKLTLALGTDEPAVWFIAPEPYLGKQILSYGSYLTFTLTNEAASEAELSSVTAPDVEIQGRNLTLHHFIRNRAKNMTEFKVRLEPGEWLHGADGGQPTREQLMLVLNSIDSISIKASYLDQATSATIDSVKLDTAIESDDVNADNMAASVEQCQCPAPYKGSSCEDCSSGHYRMPGNTGGSALGACVPCQCNGHSANCDADTGVCIDCQHNTVGDHCEQCAARYYGDATRGSEYDCRICPCPGNAGNNSFADTCNVGDDGRPISCDCYPGHTGAQCERCDAGYWGEPQKSDAGCQLCNCHGNNDLTNRRNCHELAGVCYECQNHTAGQWCEQCEPYWWGDAVTVKNCTECTCDQCGSESCDHLNGTCNCKPNVVGDNCERCEEDHWGYRQCDGCRACNCGPGAMTTQCNDTNGQCICKDGVTGQYCDRCAEGYWNYTDDGCTKCDCEADLSSGTVCDVNTGQCQCQSGATGPRCDKCIEGFLRIPTMGCRQCDECVHVLKDDIDKMQEEVDNGTAYLDTVSASALTGARLARIDKSAQEMKELTEALTAAAEKDGVAKLLDQSKTSRNNANELKIKADRSLSQINDTEAQAVDFLSRGQSAAKHAHARCDAAREIVDKVKELAQQLTEGTSAANRDQLAQEAEEILDKLRLRKFSDHEQKAEEAVQKAQELLDNITATATDPMNKQGEQLDSVTSKVDDIEKRTLAAEKVVKESDEKMEQAKKLNDASPEATEKIGELSKELEEKAKKLDEVEEYTRKRLDDAKELADEASQKFDKEIPEKIADVNATIDAVTDQNQQPTFNNTNDLMDARMKLSDARTKAHELELKADELRRNFAGTKDQTKEAREAASAYDEIVDAIDEADAAAQDAKRSATEMAEQPDDVVEQTARGRAESMDLLRDATSALESLKNNITAGLDDADEQLGDTQTQLDDVKGKMDDNKKVLADMIEARQSQELEDLKNQADALTNTANDLTKAAEVKLPDYDELTNKGAGTEDDLAKKEQAAASARTHLQQVEELTPNITDKLEEAEKAAEGASDSLKQVDEQLAKLKEKIALAREMANRIKVGGKFDGTSSLTVHSPDALMRSEAQTSATMYFNTRAHNGLLMYLGNEMGTADQTGRRLPSDDYMALLLRQGRPVLIVDMGSGPVEVKSDTVVSDGEWHMLKVNRVGRSLSLSVTSVGEEQRPTTDTKREVAGGENQVLDLNREVSKLYIGGVPAGAAMPDEVRRVGSFNGAIEDVSLNGDPVGLWNVETDGRVNVKGAEERTELKDSNDNSGVSLSGNGYVVMHKPSNWQCRKSCKIELMFRSHARDGRMFYIGSKEGRNDDMLTIELDGGHVMVQFNFGSGTSRVISTETYNDGEWHKVVMDWAEKKVELIVDMDDVTEGEPEGDNFELNVGDEYIIGGLPGYVTSAVPATGFIGCIDQLKLGGQLKNLNFESQVKQAKRVEPGCPDTSVRVVSSVADNGEAPADAKPMVQFRNITAGVDVDISLRFKTKLDAPAQLVHLSDQNQQQVFDLALDKGMLKLRSSVGTGDDKQETSVDLELTDASDGDWHFVFVKRTADTLRIRADDKYHKSVTHSDPYESITGSTLTFMANPDDESKGFLMGCLADATFNRKLMDFAQYDHMTDSVSLAGCPIEDPELVTPDPTATTADGKQRSIPPGVVTPVTPVRRPDEFETEQCGLGRTPIGPREDSNGFRFGLEPYTLWEFESLPHPFDSGGTFGIEFRATASNGVMFFATNSQHTDHFALYLLDGHLVLSYNSGSGTAMIKSPLKYIDGEWHTVLARRQGRTGSLTVDGAEVASGESPEGTNAVDTNPPFYVGGVPEHERHSAKRMLPQMHPTFSGCIRNLHLNGDSFHPAPDQTQVNGVRPCSVYTESGTYFGADGGHVVLEPRITVGKQFSLEFELKPRVSTAVLLSVIGANADSDYLTLQLSDGSLIFKVDNGAGPETMEYKPEQTRRLCDGHWHRVKVYKKHNLMMLSVDGESGKPHFLRHRQSIETNTDEAPLYLGGVPDGYENRGLKTKDSFIGCIRNLQIGEGRLRRRKSVDLLTLDKHGDVGQRQCPVN